MLNSMLTCILLFTPMSNIFDMPALSASRTVQLSETPPQTNRDNEARETAQKFESAFIAQMLQYSGLGKALTSSGGEDMQSFSQFYLEALAEKISESGGFGIADKIYAHIKNKEENYDELGKL